MRVKKKHGFLRLCIVLAGLWVLVIGALIVYFHAIGNPMDPTVAGILFAPGVGEFGFGALMQTARDKKRSDELAEENEALKAEKEALSFALEIEKETLSKELEGAQGKLAAAQADTKRLKKEVDQMKKQPQVTIDDVLRRLDAQKGE